MKPNNVSNLFFFILFGFLCSFHQNEAQSMSWLTILKCEWMKEKLKKKTGA